MNQRVKEGMSVEAVPVHILSDSDSDDDASPPTKPPLAPAPQRKGTVPPSPILLLDDDDPTPIKPGPTKPTPSSPLASSPDVAILPPSLARRPKSGRSSSDKFAGRSGTILVESDDESDSERYEKFDKKAIASSPEIGSLSDLDKDSGTELSGRSNAKYESTSTSMSLSHSENCNGIRDLSVGDDKIQYEDFLDDDLTTKISQDTNEERSLAQEENTCKRKCASDRNKTKAQADARKRLKKEEKAQLVEERKRKRQEEKLEREAMKEEARERKKLEKEKKKWEMGKLALKSIVSF